MAIGRPESAVGSLNLKPAWAQSSVGENRAVRAGAHIGGSAFEAREGRQGAPGHNQVGIPHAFEGRWIELC